MARRTSLEWLFGALLVLPGVALASASRFIADDYCMGALVARHGFLAAQVVWYQTWTGRITGTLGQTIGALPGPDAAWLLPVVLAIAVPFALGWALRPIAPFWIGPLLFLALVVAIPQPLQDLAWPDGAGTYLFPFPALAVLVGLELRDRRGLILPAVAGFFVGGSNETLAFGAGAAWLFLLVAYRRPTCAVALAGIAIGVALDAAGPGTAVRAAALNPPGLGGTFYGALSGMGLIVKFILEPWSWAAALVAGTFLQIRPSWRQVAFAWDIALIALFAAMVPNALVEGNILVPRAWIGPEFGLLLAVALTGSALGARWPLPSLAVGAALAGCLAALALSVSMTLETTRDPTSWRLDSPPTTVPWVVQCMSDYYSSR
jgi:hypothetical protein